MPSSSFLESIGNDQQTAGDGNRQKAVAKESEHFDSNTLSFTVVMGAREPSEVSR